MKFKVPTLFVACLWAGYSCHPEPQNPIIDTPAGCPEMYDARSQPYTNPYLGTLKTGTIITPQPIYPEQYSYFSPEVNPNNDYQICYCKEDNSTHLRALFMYDFCTGLAKKIGTEVLGSPNWSVKNWILFTRIDGNIWKVKPNGDSLIKLTNDADSHGGIWNPNGELFVASASTKVVDEHGIIRYTITNCGAPLGWLDNTHLINVFALSDKITTIDVTNNQIENYALTNGYGIGKFFKPTNEFTGGLRNVVNGDRFYRNVIHNPRNNSVRFLNDSFIPVSFFSGINARTTKKLIIEQSLKDTLTGTPTRINYRSHIAIMNLDGSNLRQVLLPE